MKWFGRGDRDYREELDAHLEMEVRENLDRGMSPDEAKQAALRTFGNALAVRQTLAEARPLHFWQTLSQDVRYGARLLKRSPGLTSIALEGYVPDANENKSVRIHPVSSEYFRSLSMPLIAGRPFADTDRNGAPRVAIINETMARYYFRGADPLGKRFAWWHTDPKNIEIIGVVKDAKYDNLRQDPPRLVYLPALQQGAGPNFVQIRGTTDSRRQLALLLQDCRAAIRAVNPNIRIVSLEPLAAAVNRTLAPERLVSWLSMGLGIVAVVLTSVGLYGLLAYNVVRKTTEFGIRMALGAGRLTIVRMVMKEALFLVGIGLMLGLAAAVSFGNLTAKLLFGVQPKDTITFASATVILIFVAVAAGYVPARRATRVEPVTALRNE